MSWQHGCLRRLTDACLQIEFVDASKPWKLINCWFVRQEEFRVRFKVRKSDEGELAAAAVADE